MLLPVNFREVFKSAWFSPNLLQKQGFFQKKEAKIAVLNRNYLKLVYILQDYKRQSLQHRVSRGSPRMDGNTKDGRHPHLECPVLFLGSCLPFPSDLLYSSSTSITLVQGNLFMFPDQIEVILGLGLPIFRSKKIFCKPVNDT